MSLDLTQLSTREALTAVYIGYYDRAADAAGMQFWEGVVANTSLDLTAITTDFSTQAETLDVHPFFADPATSSASAFITSLYQNLFNRDPDAAGLAFWTAALEAAVAGDPGAISVGEIIISIIQGAVDDADAGTFDRTVILNKIEVGVTWTDAAEADGGEYDAAQAASAKSIIEGVTDDAATVTAAKATIDEFFADDGGNGGGGTPGETMFLTSSTDVMDGTANDDEFLAYIQQNPFAGGVSNSLSSADRLDGGAGDDRLYAELTKEFVGVSANTNASQAVDIQPRLTGIEKIDIEARDDTEDGSNDGDTIIVDGKHITDHEEIGSYYSDGDLVIENLTTLTAGGAARNTSEITVTMDHTDNYNTDEDASDLEVLFDNDYLLSGQESEGEIRYFLLDEDAELAGNPNRLNNIDVDGLRFNIFDADGNVTAVVLEADEANTAGTHQGFVNALQAPLQALIADGTLPAGTTLTLNPLLTDFTFLDDGSRSEDIPAIVLMSGDGSRIEATGFSRIEEEIGEYDVYGRFESRNETEDQPISVDIDLHKAGRGGEGGNLIVGGKDEDTSPGIANGIEVFNISVKGAGNDDPDGGMTKPSNVGTITSTGNQLRVVNIVTDPDFASGSTYASLIVRNGFDQSTTSDTESGDLQLVNADGFLGDLVLGDIDAANDAGRITNLDTLTAQGGGDVEFNGLLNGLETAQAYSYTTGSGDDIVTLDMDGDALDYAGSSVNIATNGGSDRVEIDFTGQIDNGVVNNNQLNQAILDNVTIDTGSGADVIDVDGVGNANISAGTGNDVIYTDGNAQFGSNAIWALNVDAVRAGAQGLSSNGPGDLPGEQTSLAYLSQAAVTVTLSGAGIGSYFDGGGVMSQGAAGAVRASDGYEKTVVIGSLNNGNEHYGDQTDINDAIMRAINEDPVLSNLLTAVIGANNTLVVLSNTSGNFADIDLRVDILQKTADSATYANSVLDEARSLFSDSTISLTDLWGTTTFSTTSPANYQGDVGGTYGADLNSSATADAWYDGLSVQGDTENSVAAGVGEGLSNLHTFGSASAIEADNVIDAGPGNDVIVLSTDAIGGGVTPFTTSSNNAMMNGASNETIVLTTLDFGDDTVMNFTFDSAEAGVDFLDFTEYLTSLTSPSGSSASTVPIPVTMDNALGTASPTDAVAANEVVLLTLDADNNAEWEAFGAADLAALFNNSDGTGDYDDDLLDTAFSVVVDTSATAVVNGASKAIVGVENADNDGEIRFFELTWNSSDTPSTLTHTVTAVELGELDFGDTPMMASAANLVGSTEYSDLLAAFPA